MNRDFWFWLVLGGWIVTLVAGHLMFKQADKTFDGLFGSFQTVVAQRNECYGIPTPTPWAAK